MRFLSNVSLVVGFVVVWPSFATAQSNGGKADLSDNAALQYWQAFSQMPPLDEEQAKLVAEWQTVSLDDPAVQKILDQSHKSMLYLRRAARCEACDWGLEYNDGIGLLLPHLTKSRDLARLAALYTRNEYERGNRKALPENAAAMMVLARHVGRDPFMISLLVRYGIEGFVVDLVAPHVPDIKVPYAKAVGIFESLPPAPDLRQSIAAEKKVFFGWMLKKLREEEARKPGGGLVLWKNFLGADAPDELKHAESFEQIMNMTEQLGPMYDELEKLVALPAPQFDAQYPKFKERITASQPLGKMYLPAVDGILGKERRNQVRMAMLLAAIAVSTSGPEKLKDIKDPFGDGPFEYRSLGGGGFELQSNLDFEGKPVTLAVGRQPTK